MSEKLHNEKKIMRVTVIGGILFSLFEISMAIYSNSQAVLMDSIYDGAEAIALALMVFFIPYLYKPVSEKKPYGYSQLESLFILAKGGMLLAVTIGLIAGNLQMMANGGNHINHSMIGYFELFLAIISFLILFILMYWNKKVSSPIIEAEVLGWKIDVVSSMGVAFAFFITPMLKNTEYSVIIPYIDQFVAILIALVMLPQPYHLMKEAFKNLILFAPSKDIMDDIKNTIDQEFEKYAYRITFYDVIQTGRKTWIEIYVQSDAKILNIEQLRFLKENIIQNLITEYEDVDVQITPEL